MLNEAETLGLRLDAGLARQLSRFASSARRSKSDVVRDALRAYLDADAVEADFRREVAAIAAATSADDLALLDAIHDDTMSDEADYRWAGRAA